MIEQRDIFLCHASEDKNDVLKPLIAELEQSGVTYWYDEAEIRWGDSITKRVNEGLRLSQFVLVVFSEAFVNKNWPERELYAALNVEASTGTVRILPLLCGTPEQCEKIRDAYPILNDKAFMIWQSDVLSIVDALKTRLSSHRPIRTTVSKSSRHQQPFVHVPDLPEERPSGSELQLPVGESRREQDSACTVVGHYDFLKKRVQEVWHRDSGAAIIYLDLDGFKGLNRQWGAEVGDRVVCIVNGLVQEVLGKDRSGRWAKDSWLGCLEHISLKDAEKLAKQLSLRILRHRWRELAPGLYVSASVGIAQRWGHGTPEEWIISAIHGARAAKKKGGKAVARGPEILPKHYSRELHDYDSD
jgi:diguanylate cyclase (GGDEF)-like protein